MQAIGNELEIKTEIGEKKRIINIYHANMCNAKVSASPRPWDETPMGEKCRPPKEVEEYPLSQCLCPGK